jgi:hypothetical protein
MATPAKTLVDQHFLSLNLPFAEEPDLQNFVLLVMLGYTPKELAAITNLTERSLRRWLSGERAKSFAVYEKLQLVIERSRNTLRRKSRIKHKNKWQSEYRRYLIDLANLCDLALSIHHPQTHREKVLAHYHRRKAQRTNVGQSA